MITIKQALILLVFIFLSSFLYSQSLDWAVGSGGTDWDEGTGIVVDEFGHIYVCGSFFNTVDFDPGPSVKNLTSEGEEDIFIQKLDENGNLLWVHRIGGVLWDKALGLTIDHLRNITITGVFSDSVDFDPSVGGRNVLHTANPFGDQDIFILKLDWRGNFLWAKSIGGRSWDAGNAICTDRLGDLYVTGHFKETVDFDPNVGVFNLSAQQSDDVFILKLDFNGNFVWARQFVGLQGDDEGCGITVDSWDNVYTTGTFFGTIDFDPGMDSTKLSSAGSGDVFVHKLDKNGNFEWVRRKGSGGGHDIALDSLGNVYAGGAVSYAGGNIGQNAFIHKWNAEGDSIWDVEFGGNFDDEVFALCVNNIGEVFSTGVFWGKVDFDPGPGFYYLEPPDLNDIFIQKLDPSANLIWARRIGGEGDDRGYDITLDDFGNIYSTGFFSETVDFDPNSGSQILRGNGLFDVFVQKWHAGNNMNLDEEEASFFSLYPNPSDGIFFLNKSTDLPIARLTLYDHMGKKIKEISGNWTYKRWELSYLPEGIYHLIGEFDNSKRSYQKILISR